MRKIVTAFLAVLLVFVFTSSSLAALGTYSEEPQGSANQPAPASRSSSTLSQCLSGGSKYRDVLEGSSSNPVTVTYKKGWGKITNYTGGLRFYIRVYLGKTNHYVDTNKIFFSAGTSSTIKQYTDEYRIPAGVGRHDAAHRAIAKCDNY